MLFQTENSKEKGKLGRYHLVVTSQYFTDINDFTDGICQKKKRERIEGSICQDCSRITAMTVPTH